MIELYQWASSPFGSKIRRVLAYRGIPFEIIEISRDEVDNYREVVPYGKIPCIRHGDTVVADSSDIFVYLERELSGKSLTPANLRDAALAHIVEDWADESLYFYEITMRAAWKHNAGPTFQKLFPEAAASILVEQGAQMLSDMATPIVEGQGIGKKSQAHVVGDVRRHLTAIEALLQDMEWLLDGAISIADISVLVMLDCMLGAQEFVALLEEFPTVKAWMDRVDAMAPDPSETARASV